MKRLILAGLALVCAAGMIFLVERYLDLRGELTAARLAVDQFETVQSGLRTQLEDTEAELAQVIDENEWLRLEVAELSRERAQVASQAVEPEVIAGQEEAHTAAGNADATAADDGERRERRARAFREQREDMEGRMRDRFTAMMDAQWQKADDQATRDRIEALIDYRDYINQLRESMPAVETDEERQALFQEMRAARADMQDIVQAQQNAMIRDLAASHGIDGVEAQTAFVQQIQETMQGPFFRMGGAMVTGGGPWLGRSRDGWRGRGGGRGSGDGED